MSTIERAPEAVFEPQDYLPLSEFEAAGWMVVDGVEPVARNAKVTMRNGTVVNTIKEMLQRAEAVSSSRLFEKPFVAYDNATDSYVAVRKRTPLGQAEWNRANR